MRNNSQLGQSSNIFANNESKLNDREDMDRMAITWHSNQPDTALTHGYVAPQGINDAPYSPPHGSKDSTPPLNPNPQFAYHRLIIYEGDSSLSRPVVAQANAPLALANTTMFESDPTDRALYPDDGLPDAVVIDTPPNIPQNTIATEPPAGRAHSPRTGRFDPLHPMIHGRALRFKYTLLMRIGATSPGDQPYDPRGEGFMSSDHDKINPEM